MNLAQGSRQQKGGVLAEFVVVTGFIIMPLIMLLPVLFSYIESRQYMEQSARYSVWERTAYFQALPAEAVAYAPVKNDSDIAAEIQNRILSAKDVAIKLAQRDAELAEPLNPNLRLTDRATAKRVSMYEPAAEGSHFVVTHATTQHGLSGVAELQEKVVNAISLLPGFSLNTEGLYQAEVGIKLKPLSWFSELGTEALNPRRQNALLAEGWTIGGPAQAQSTIRGLVPITSFMDDIGFDRVLGLISFFPLAKELGSDYLQLGKVEVDAIPCSRLGVIDRRGRVSTPSQCVQRIDSQLRSYRYRYRE
ncbi:hypothetical protein SAMN05660691_01605 [Rheinheimera pacifica]|uniref:TadE-like protein n=1 Tax=Rheinheimera pacifica TaxID=173990 RepID=A0A1H6L9T8_9GAMM|nr:hypothetical protein [Rheinheimera pacifica]SEH81032.1 hypothetical protein SAMN05660691_01605 [Rheinheimera pacifica]